MREPYRQLRKRELTEKHRGHFADKVMYALIILVIVFFWVCAAYGFIKLITNFIIWPR